MKTYMITKNLLFFTAMLSLHACNFGQKGERVQVHSNTVNNDGNTLEQRSVIDPLKVDYVYPYLPNNHLFISVSDDDKRKLFRDGKNVAYVAQHSKGLIGNHGDDIVCELPDNAKVEIIRSVLTTKGRLAYVNTDECLPTKDLITDATEVFVPSSSLAAVASDDYDYELRNQRLLAKANKIDDIIADQARDGVGCDEGDVFMICDEPAPEDPCAVKLVRGSMGLSGRSTSPASLIMDETGSRGILNMLGGEGSSHVNMQASSSSNQTVILSRTLNGTDFRNLNPAASNKAGVMAYNLKPGSYRVRLTLSDKTVQENIARIQGTCNGFARHMPNHPDLDNCVEDRIEILENLKTLPTKIFNPQQYVLSESSVQLNIAHNRLNALNISNHAVPEDLAFIPLSDIMDLAILKQKLNLPANANYSQIANAFGPQTGWFNAQYSISLEPIATIDSDYACGGEGSFVSPIILKFSTDAKIATVPLESSKVEFDLNNKGKAMKTGWVKPQDGILVLDVKQDGVIKSGAQLLGEYTLVPGTKKSRHANGYEALKLLDSDSDGFITDKDVLKDGTKVFDILKVWFDKNQNGISDPGELQSLSSLGITKISTKYKKIENSSSLIYSKGENQVKYHSRFFGPKNCGEQGCSSFDIFFATK